MLTEQPAGTPLVDASGDQEWWLEISTVRAHICQINWQIYPPVEASSIVRNGDLTFLLLELILANQLAEPPLQ